MEYLVVFGVLGAIAVVAGFLIARHNRRITTASNAKNEALFASMFPDLQPYYHPRRVLGFVRSRLSQAPARGGMTMKNPPGFDVPAADVRYETDGKGRSRELWRLLDAGGRELSRFYYEEDAKDGMVRVGEGKFRVARVGDRVRYWHPGREFKWLPPAMWKFDTRVFERPVETTRDDGIGFSDSSSSRAAGTAAAAAGIAAAGGTFDGGGASAAWDGANSGGESAFEGSEASASAGSTSY